MKTLRLLTLACAVALPCLAQAASPWDGTWKIDLSKSHYEGQSFNYSKTSSGMWHVSWGNLGFDFAADGKAYPTLDKDSTIVVHAKGDHELMWDNKLNGTTLSTTDETLSSDGKVLTDHTTGTRPDGTKVDDTTTYARVSGGPGFLGTWKSTKVKTSENASYVIRTAGDGTLTWDIPDYKMTFTGKADGMDVPVSGPQVPPGMTLALKKISGMQLDYTVKSSGKVVSMGKMTIVDGGKALTDVSWAPGAEGEKTTSYYVKQ